MSRMSRLAISSCVLILAGCSANRPVATVSFSYKMEPKTPLSEQYMQLAVRNAEMTGDTAEYDQAKWSRMTADMIQYYLEQAAEKDKVPLKLVDREHVKMTMEEKDLALANVSDSGDAKGSAQIKGANAIISSKVTIKIDKQVGKKRTIDAMSVLGGGWSHGGFGGGSVDTEQVDEEARNITVQCQFQLKDAATNEVITSYNSKPEQCFTKTKASPFFGSSKTEADMTPRDKVIGDMIERSAQVFLGKIVPMEVEASASVKPSSDENSIAGARALVTDDYEAALVAFKAAISTDMNDHASLFGAGVACEKLKRLEEARKYYKQAQSLKPSDAQYAEAVARVMRMS